MFVESLDYWDRDLTFYEFLSYTKAFLKQLLSNPLGADINPSLVENGLSREKLLNALLERGIVEKETKIEDINDRDKYSVLYKIPKKNFDRKMRRLFSQLFETNEITESIVIKEECGGAASCGSAMQGGGSNPDAGQFIQPLGKVQRRKIYITQEQVDMLKETTTQDSGNYQYDVPLKFNGGNDPAYNHKNMISGGIPKKKGVRRKNNG